MMDSADAEIEAAAQVLFAAGLRHHWWPKSILSYESLDPVGKEEFAAIVAEVLTAAAKVRAA